MPWKITTITEGASARDITRALLSGPDKAELTHEDVATVVAGSRPDYLRIEHTRNTAWRPLTIAYGTPFRLSLREPALSADAKTALVYFINCYLQKNFIYLFRKQMRDLRETGILRETRATLHIVSSGSEANRALLESETNNIFPGLSNIRFSHTAENLYEYPGIRQVWEIGQRERDTFVLYFHARGISKIKLGRFRRNRQRVEQRLFRRVIGEWRENLLWLQQISTAAKLGMTQGGNGWLWYNFWWAKSAYIARLEEPERTTRRHYYEDWLARVSDGTQPTGAETERVYPNTLDSCISIAASPRWQKYHIGSDFHPDRGETHMGLPFFTLRRTGLKLLKWLKRR